MIHNLIAEQFRKAVASPGNILNGKVDYDFVCADILIDLTIPRLIEEMGSLEEFYKVFDAMVDLELALEAA
jgi:hypothetical protein